MKTTKKRKTVKTKKTLLPPISKMNRFGLTMSQEAFCHEYMYDFNGTRSYGAAYPFSKDTARGAMAHDLLKRPEVQARLARLVEERNRRSAITNDRILNELAKPAFNNVTTRLQYNDKLKALEMLARHKSLFNDKLDLAPQQHKHTFDLSGIDPESLAKLREVMRAAFRPKKVD